jgi:hypothetical protein
MQYPRYRIAFQPHHRAARRCRIIVVIAFAVACAGACGPRTDDSPLQVGASGPSSQSTATMEPTTTTAVLSSSADRTLVRDWLTHYVAMSTQMGSLASGGGARSISAYSSLRETAGTLAQESDLIIEKLSSIEKGAKGESEGRVLARDLAAFSPPLKAVSGCYTPNSCLDALDLAIVPFQASGRSMPAFREAIGFDSSK